MRMHLGLGEREIDRSPEAIDRFDPQGRPPAPQDTMTDERSFDVKSKIRFVKNINGDYEILRDGNYVGFIRKVKTSEAPYGPKLPWHLVCDSIPQGYYGTFGEAKAVVLA